MRKVMCVRLVMGWFTGREAGDTYDQLADLHVKLGSQHEAATSYVEAAKALMKLPSKGIGSGLAPWVLPQFWMKVDYGM